MGGYMTMPHQQKSRKGHIKHNIIR